MRKKVESGKLTISGSDDVLTLALGTPEHSGRVRGVGGFVNPSTYFNLPKRRKESVQETVRLSVQRILAEERDKIIEEAKDRIIAEERAFWMARLEHLEAKLDAREAGKVDVDIPHVSGHGSCSQTANQTLDEGLVGEEVANLMDGKSIRKVCDQLEQNYLCKASKTLREKVRKPVSRAQQKNDVIKMAEKAKTILEDKVEENLEDNAKPQYVQEQEHEEMEFVDLMVLGDKSKVCWFPDYFKVEFINVSWACLV